MKYPRNEQETIIRKYADEDVWHIYTSDTVMMAKLDKLVETSDEWQFVAQNTSENEVVSRDYTCPKNLISIRTKTVKRPGAGDHFKAKIDHHDGEI